MLDCDPRITRSGSSPGINAEVAPPNLKSSAGGRSYAGIDRHRVAVQRSHRQRSQIGQYVGATSAGSHVSAGTVALVLMAKSSAQSLANAIAYSTKSG